MVYIVHFSEKIGHAGHYIGSCKNLTKRMKMHETGRTTPLMRVARERSITFRVSIIDKEGMKQRERQIKDRGGATKSCPICKGKRGGKIWGEHC